MLCVLYWNQNKSFNLIVVFELIEMNGLSVFCLIYFWYLTAPRRLVILLMRVFVFCTNVLLLPKSDMLVRYVTDESLPDQLVLASPSVARWCECIVDWLLLLFPLLLLLLFFHSGTVELELGTELFEYLGDESLCWFFPRFCLEEEEEKSSTKLKLESKKDSPLDVDHVFAYHCYYSVWCRSFSNRWTSSCQQQYSTAALRHPPLHLVPYTLNVWTLERVCTQWF